MRERLIEYFGDGKIWVDAHDEETAQALVDWIDSEIGSHFGSVHRGYPNEDVALFAVYACTRFIQ